MWGTGESGQPDYKAGQREADLQERSFRLSIGTQKGPPIGVQKGPPFGGPLPGVVGGRWWCSGADGAVGKWPAGATVGESGAGGPLIHSGGVR